ncbi:FAM10 family protein At4g22670 isoform X2 [Diospyros lotus]|uniref:FAM10 family protein At4g22670 isoform X2 n=1 Tax=Diospyros lotus TaxID=55363 RepID=UPI0022521177|nr:FAM10 family protein At4g22670 isoform X2 [Diospyros lotus]
MEEKGPDAEKVAELKLFVEQCKSNPSILRDPSLAFFKSYLQSMGGRIPPEASDSDKGVDDFLDSEKHDTGRPSPSGDDKLDEDIIESDIELDDTDVLEPDNDPPLKVGDPSIEVTEENRDDAQMLKSKAMDSISEGKLHEAIDYLTEAIMLNPSSAILYATRASVSVQMNKPNAAIHDADAALQINPDSAKGYKIRGMARALLGQWEEAARDLHVASKLDYDEEISMILKKVEPNARKIEEHRRKYERLRRERELRKIKHERQHRQAEAQETYEREKKMGQSSESKSSDPVAESALKDDSDRTTSVFNMQILVCLISEVPFVSPIVHFNILVTFNFS